MEPHFTPFSDTALNAMTFLAVFAVTVLFSLRGWRKLERESRLTDPAKQFIVTRPVMVPMLFALVYVLLGFDQTPPLGPILVTAAEMLGLRWPDTFWF